MPVILAKTKQETTQLARNLARCCPENKKMILFFNGELGAGKTFFVRAFLSGLGYRGLVKSPTYTLMESYHLGLFSIYHLDLYRFKSANEIFDTGLHDELDSNGIWLIEWPERALAFLPRPDIVCHIDIIETYRRIQFFAKSPEGQQILHRLNKKV